MGALGHHVDGAADRAGGRHAVQHRARPLQHLDAFGQFDPDRIGRQQTIEPAIGDVGALDGEAADHHVLRAVVAGRPHDAHRRIVDQHVANGLRLLVLRLLRGVARLVERRFHDVAIAQQAELATGRHLSTGVSGRDVVDHRLRRHRKYALHLHGIELQRRGIERRLPHALERDGRAAEQAVGQAGAGEQALQRLVDAHRALHARRRETAHECAVGRDLAAGLLTEHGQRAGEGLCRDVEGALRRRLDGLHVGRLCQGRRCPRRQCHRDRRRGQCSLDAQRIQTPIHRRNISPQSRNIRRGTSTGDGGAARPRSFTGATSGPPTFLRKSFGRKFRRHDAETTRSHGVTRRTLAPCTRAMPRSASSGSARL